MGIELERFCSDVDAEFICAICANVLKNAVRIFDCEHMFCRECIDSWMAQSSTCPVDRSVISAGDLVALNRTVVSFLNRLRIKCEFEPEGCRHVDSLESIENHSKDCDFDPNKKWPCRAGCEVLMNRAEAITHRCVKTMEIEIAELKEEVDRCEKEVDQYQETINELIEKNGDLETKNKHQEEMMENLKKEIEEQKNKVREIELNIEEICKRNADLETRNKTLEETNAKIVQISSGVKIGNEQETPKCASTSRKSDQTTPKVTNNKSKAPAKRRKY